ncbi:hypothetical protein MOMUL_22330 [Moorella mulderi DSM 14980]|uniref:Transposase InsH N-terminal domain-containing protein n=2 Tax=Neomoorella TaxID=44260 RepID=A0A151AUZ8_9FIRM|nr:hypothetical protein MOMUL_22330 [Moorella mulderi DSM 14980]
MYADGNRMTMIITYILELLPIKAGWAPIYYEHVFCKIDEKKFAPLYCENNGRPNKPVNILLSLEFIKHLYDYTD